MFTFLAVVHVVASVVMIIFILLQDPKGSGAMGMLGGGSKSLFSTTGANHFLISITKWTAVIFAFTSIYLATLSSQKGPSVLDELVETESAIQQKSTKKQKEDDSKK